MRSVLLFCAAVSAAACAAFGLTTSGGAPPPETRFDAVRTLAEQAVRDGTVPSVAIAVAQHGRIVWEEAFGFADRERGIRATPHTSYSLASVSKPFTATGFMVLVERGRVQLDDPANRHLGEARLRAFLDDADEATVLRLLTHTAGLPTHYQFLFDGDGLRVPMDETIRRYGILVYPPGTRSVYANLGYGVLDEIVGRISGRGFAAFMDEEVFGPLGLASTSVGAIPGSDGVAVRYGRDGRPLPDYQVDHVGASLIFASVHDLMRFALFHLGHTLPDQVPILDAATLARMRRSEVPAGSDSPGQWRGLGWMVQTTPRGFWRVWHTGSMPGVSTVLSLYPDQDLALAVLVNASEGDLTMRLAGALEDAMLPPRPLVQRGPPPLPVAGESSGLPRGVRGRWSGHVETWETRLPLVLDVNGPGEVIATVDGGQTVALQGAAWRDGILMGHLWLDMPLSDTQGIPHAVGLRLHRRGNRLTGWAVAVAATAQPRFALSSWVELSRE